MKITFENFLKFVIGCILIFALVIMVFGVASVFEKSKLIQECLDDGHKNYECEGIIRGCRSN